ncbi:tetratricopeptide repeat protein, partial [bacterium]|nr:tetratricopeptide repeat protein [bacterium]
ESARYEADALQPDNGEVIEALCLFSDEMMRFRLEFQTTSFRVFAVGKTPTGKPFYGDRRAYELAGSPAGASPVGDYSPLFDPGSPIVAEADPKERPRLLYEALDEYNLGAALYNGGRYDRAVPRFRRVLEEVGDLNRAGYWLSSALYRSGDPIGAEKELLLFGEKCPGDLDGLLLHADILTVLGRSTESLVLLQEAISNLPDEPRLYEKLAELYRDLGDVEQTELLFLRAREVSDDR